MNGRDRDIELHRGVWKMILVVGMYSAVSYCKSYALKAVKEKVASRKKRNGG